MFRCYRVFSFLEEMAETQPTRVLILGHSFIHRLQSFIVSRYSLSFLSNLQLSKNLHIRWQGIGGRTVSKVVMYDLGVVGSFPPEIVIVQLGSNDLTSMSAAKIGSAIEDLVYCSNVMA